MPDVLATLANRTPDLVNVSLLNTDAAGSMFKLLSDGQTCVYNKAGRLYTSQNYGVAFNSGPVLIDNTYDIRAILEIPGGEVLVSLKKNNTNGPGGYGDATGVVYRSTGWNKTTANATSWAVVLTTSGPGCYVRGLWGLNEWGVAPTWSKHAGSIFASEYGPHLTSAATPSQSAHVVWRSDDDGRTWTQIYSLLDHYAPTYQMHVHGVCYDPWDSRVYVTVGDGGGSPSGFCGVWYTDNAESSNPTWTEIAEMRTSTGTYQSTAVAAVEAGVMLLSDGPPGGASLIPRRRRKQLGSRITAALRRYPLSAPFIGATLHRNGFTSTPHPDAPIFASFIEPGGDLGIPVIWVSPDGRSMREAYRHTAVGEIGYVAGPTIDGTIVADISLSGVHYTLTGNYSPPLQPTTAGVNAAPAASNTGKAARVTLTSGNYVLNNATWTSVDPGTLADLVVNAAAGEWVELGLSAQWANEAVQGFLDFATIVSAAVVNYVGAAGGTTEGAQCWYGVASATSKAGGALMYKVQSGDVVNGQVTFRLYYKTSSAANKTLRATSTDRLDMWARNHG